MVKKIAKAVKKVKETGELCPFCGKKAGAATSGDNFKCGECSKTWRKSKTVEKKVGKKADAEVKTSRKEPKAPKEEKERGRNAKYTVSGTYNNKKVEPIGIKKFAAPFFEDVEFPTIYGLHSYKARDFILNGELKVSGNIIKLPKSNAGLTVMLNGEPYVPEAKAPKKEKAAKVKKASKQEEDEAEAPAKKVKKVLKLKKKAVVEDDEE